MGIELTSFESAQCDFFLRFHKISYLQIPSESERVSTQNKAKLELSKNVCVQSSPPLKVTFLCRLCFGVLSCCFLLPQSPECLAWVIWTFATPLHSEYAATAALVLHNINLGVCDHHDH